MLQYEEINCFWHQEDSYTITSKKYIWAYPGYYGNNDRTIAVKPSENMNLNLFYGCQINPSNLIMKNILVLCTGNSCRSQMAHGYFSKKLVFYEPTRGSQAARTVLARFPLQPRAPLGKSQPSRMVCGGCAAAQAPAPWPIQAVAAARSGPAWRRPTALGPQGRPPRR